MPFRSEAQRRYFMANREKLERQGVDVDEWVDSTGKRKLPERVKKAASGAGLLAPITTLAREVVGLNPPDTALFPSFTDKAQHYLDAREELGRLKDEEQESRWGRRFRNLGLGAAAGALLGVPKGFIASQGDPNITLATGATLGGVGALAGFGTALARDLNRRRLREKFIQTANQTPEHIRTVIDQDPEVRSHVRDLASASWHPWYGLEAGITLGSLGALGAGWAAGHKPKTLAYQTLAGAALGGTAGVLLGMLWKRRQKKRLLRSLQGKFDAISPSEGAVEQAVVNELDLPSTPSQTLKAAMVSSLPNNGPAHLPPHKGWPVKPSNGQFARNQSPVERYAGGRWVKTSELLGRVARNGQLAEQLAKRMT